MRVYLDNCCYNRPYDDQNQLRIHLETEAKLYIQELIVEKEIELVSSYVLLYENSQNRDAHKKTAISDFISEYEAYYVDVEKDYEISRLATEAPESLLEKWRRNNERSYK